MKGRQGNKIKFISNDRRLKSSSMKEVNRGQLKASTKHGNLEDEDKMLTYN